MTQRDDPTYELISAYVDGELSPDERARVEQLVAGSDEYRQTLAEYRAVSGGMQLLPPCRLDPSFPQRVVAAARKLGTAFDELTPAPDGPAPVRPGTSVWHWPTAVGFLATLAAVTLAAVLIWGPDSGSLTPDMWGRMSDATPREPGTSDDLATGPPTASSGGTPSAGEHVQVTDESPMPGSPAADTRAEKPGVLAGAQEPPGATGPTADPESAPPRDALAPPGPGSDRTGRSNALADSVPKARVAPKLADEPRPTEHTSMPGDDQIARRAIVERRFSGPQQVLLVIDVALTRQGLEKGAFTQMLSAQGIPVEDVAPVDNQLEEVMLASRFFEPVKAPAEGMAATDISLSLVYVRARAGQIDDLWRAMQGVPGDFSHVTLDMAIMPADQAMFQDLRRVVDVEPTEAPAVGDDQPRGRSSTAHPLKLAPSWRGTIPAWMLDKDAREEPAIEGIPGQPAPKVPLPPGGRMGENVDAEALFVVHVGRVPSGE